MSSAAIVYVARAHRATVNGSLHPANLWVSGAQLNLSRLALAAVTIEVLTRVGGAITY